MKKWFEIQASYSDNSLPETKVKFISENDITQELPNYFFHSDEHGLQIFELTSNGEKVERKDLSEKIVEERNNNYYDSLN